MLHHSVHVGNNLTSVSFNLIKYQLLFFWTGTLIDGKPIIILPPKTINLTSVDFSAEERAFYVNLEAESRSRFKVIKSHFVSQL